IPVTVVPTSCATVAIDTFITELSSVMRNWPAASVSRTMPAPFAAVVWTSGRSIRRMLLARGGRRVHQLRRHDQALARGVPRVTGREDERRVGRLRQDLARGGLGQHEVGGDLVVVVAVACDQGDRVALLHLIEV